MHNYLGTGTHMFPLNIGYLAAYANKFYKDDIEVELFKYPDDFMKKFEEEKADLVGFSNYTWSADLNNRISSWVKSISPETIVVFGGPNINYSKIGYQRFFSKYKAVDFYILYQGERAFISIIKNIIEKGKDISILKSEPLDGIVFEKNNKIILGGLLARIKDVDSIPSPYLTGILDKFFDTNLIPIVETNRGCPYTCTYCCQGLSSYNQIEFFNFDRVKQELSYIAKKVKNTNILIFADSNFGILERDIEIAEHLAELMKETGYPRRISMNWAKNQPKIFEIAKILNNINLIISLQSLDEQVLKAIKRQNIQISFFKDIIEKINKENAISGTEIILALPNETKKSHLDSIRKLFDWNVSYIICYNCFILEGSEMSLLRERGEFNCKTKFRLVDNAFGRYGSIISFESEESIRTSPTMSEEDILYFRPVHWLIQFLWNYRFYYDLLKYIQFLKINPLDYIIKLIDDAEQKAPEKIKRIFQEFKEEAENEWFDSHEDLIKYWSSPFHFEELEKGNYGKMNNKYIFKTLVETKEDFEAYLYNTAVELFESKKQVFKEILNMLSASIIDFTLDEGEFLKEKSVLSKYDVLKWRELGYSKNLEELCRSKDENLQFYLPLQQKKSLELLFKQYRHPNRNVTLRKMSEYMDIRDFFYKVGLAN